MKILIIKANGSVDEVELKEKLSLEQMQEYVGGFIECIEFPDGRTIVLNEEGRLNGLPLNSKAMEVWKEQFPPEKYKFNNDGLIHGNILITDKDYPWNEE